MSLRVPTIADADVATAAAVTPKRTPPLLSLMMMMMMMMSLVHVSAMHSQPRTSTRRLPCFIERKTSNGKKKDLKPQRH